MTVGEEVPDGIRDALGPVAFTIVQRQREYNVCVFPQDYQVFTIDVGPGTVDARPWTSAQWLAMTFPVTHGNAGNL